MGKVTRILVNFDRDFPLHTGHFIERSCKELGIEVTDKDPDLVLNIDGVTDFIKGEGVPTFYWEIDAYRHRGQFGDRYTNSDRVFVATLLPETWAHLGYPKSKSLWLPVAFDETVHKPHDIEKEYDVVFVGRTHGGREEMLNNLKKKFKVLVTQADKEKYAKEMSRGKLIFNKSVDGEINSRFFEGMAIGALVTDRVDGAHRLAVPYVHYIPYSDERSLERQIERYLAEDEDRLKIAKNAQEMALSNHTFTHRLKTILSYV